MGDSARQVADAFHLLRLAQPIFGFAQICLGALALDRESDLAAH